MISKHNKNVAETDRIRLAGFIRRPTTDELQELLKKEYINLEGNELHEFNEMLDQMLCLFDSLDDLSLPELEIKYPIREKGRRPSNEEDPYNAFIRKCNVKGSNTGKLRGKKIGIKDNIRLAGVPMTNGSRFLQHYVPDIDATVVERLLDEGAVIVGKLNMDDFGFAGTGETSAFGCVRNPNNPDFSAGGSSGGSGAAVASEAVDLAIAVDQGGSSRIPASWCGVVTIKPTHGLVPSFGITYLDHTTDFVCPIGRSIKDVAITLEVIAGEDPKDPQWVKDQLVVEKYSENLNNSINGTKIGIIKESIESDQLESDVLSNFDKALKLLEDNGAQLQKISIPFWSYGQAIWNGFAVHGITTMIESEQEGFGRRGICDIGWQEAFANARRTASNDFPTGLKLLMAAGLYLRREQKSIYFSKATNLRYVARKQVDNALETFDVLVTPTTPMKALRLKTEKQSLKEMVKRGASMCQNTYPLNVTGHPAVSMPVGFGENNLPTSIQLIGSYFSEKKLFQIGSFLEKINNG